MESKLKEKGYEQSQIDLIMNLDEDNQQKFLDEYDQSLLKYLSEKDFMKDKLDEYQKYDGLLETKKLIELVNNDVINETNSIKLKKLYESEYFIPKNEKLYLEYIDKYEDVDKMREIVNTRRYLDLYSDIVDTDLSKGVRMLINKYYRLPADYEPDDLVAVDPALGRGYLRKEVYEAYQPLYEEAVKQGFNLKVVSAYRPYKMQDDLYNGYLKKDPQEVVDTYSARPGHSEHQSGLCMDVSEPGYSLDNFYQTKASKWLAENCHKYGFIIRYPEDKTDITGYQGEPWQLRYVGKETAEDVYRRAITYDEYYACFVE